MSWPSSSTTVAASSIRDGYPLHRVGKSKQWGFVTMGHSGNKPSGCS